MRTILTIAHLVTPAEAPPGSALVLEGGKVAAILPRASVSRRADDLVLNYPTSTAAPALLDIHIHGCGGHDVMEATPAAFQAVSSYLATCGVAAFLATTVTAPMDGTLRALTGIAAQIRSAAELPGARPIGIHLEGPFLSHARRGVHPPAHLQPPSIAVFDRLWQAAEGYIKLMTIAPELPGAAELIAHATRMGIRISLGHSDATAEQTRSGIAAGATSATHTFNAMRALNHREPGIAGAVLDDESLYAEIICDGLHVAPEMVRLFWKAKGRERTILVTDAMSATGRPDGVYKLGGLDVTVSGGVCRLDGALAGSTLTLDRAVQNFRTITEAPLAAAAALAAQNPARMLGMEGSIGSLAAGRAADVVVIAPDGRIEATLLNGRLVFSSS